MKNSKTYTEKRLTIKDWGIQDRPREKYIANGGSALSDAEILAILIRTGNLQESAVELSKRLLSFSNNSLNTLSRKSFKELSSIKGIGKTKAITLLAAFELGKRLGLEKIESKKSISSSLDVVELMKNKIAYLSHEEFWVILLDNSNHILKTSQVSKGGITKTIVDVRVLLKEALSMNATALIVCHNHPSENLLPSQADKDVTRKISSAAKTIDITLIDHVILSGELYFSFAEQGIL